MATDSKLKRAGVSGYNKPKRTPNAKKSHLVVAKVGAQTKTLRFGQQGVKGSPAKAGESAAAKARRKSFNARHKCDEATDKLSARYWSCKHKW